MKHLLILLLFSLSLSLSAQLQTAIGLVPLATYTTTSNPFLSEFTYSVGPVLYVGTNTHVLKGAFIYSTGNSDFKEIEATSQFNVAYRFNFEFLRTKYGMHESLLPFIESEIVFQNYTETDRVVTKTESFDNLKFFPKLGMEMRLYKNLWVDFGVGYNVRINHNVRGAEPWVAIKYNFVRINREDKEE